MIFISHSSEDHDAATALHAKLLARDYDPSQLFLDSDADSGIAAGQQWQQVLYARLKDCRALIVLCTQNWLDSKWCFAELIYAKASGKEIFPVILEPCDFRGALDEHQAVFVHRDGDAAYERLWRALDTRHLGPRDDFGWPPKDGDACPFPGLLSFDERYAGVYFGREPETQAVLEELRKMRANGEPRLLMITGGSGSGKSSLLKAGVLPQLTHKSSGTEWLVLPVMRYGQAASPQHTVFDQLAMNVAQADWKVLRDAFSGPDGAKAFVDAARDLAVARGSPGATVLLPVDQFEELLAPGAGPDAGAFLRFLHEVFGVANGRLLAIGTMRSDHLDVYERHPYALTAPYFQPWRLGPFPRDRVRDVIVKPAARAGVEVTPDLLARLERDTPSSESLPLLAFTLEKLYRRYATDRKLELQEYEELGGMEGAIQKSADAIALGPDVLDAVRLTFVKHLASFNDKDEAVRITARWSDLPDAAKPALERFVADRLLVKNDYDDEGGRWVSVEVAHEALFGAWPALKKWLDDAADVLRWRRDVKRDRVADPRWLALRPSQLAVARPWLRQRRNELTDAEVGWIRKSIWRERAQWGLAALVVGMIFTFAVYAFWQKGEADRAGLVALEQKRAAEHASQISLGRFLASQSSEVAKLQARNLGQGLLLAIEGYRRDPSAVTAGFLRNAMAMAPLPIARLRHDGPVSDVQFSPDGKWLATSDATGTVRVWNYENEAQVASIHRGNDVPVVAWRPDGEQIAAVVDSAQRRQGPGEVVFWDWRTKAPPAVEIPPQRSRIQFTSSAEQWLLQLSPGQLKVWGAGVPKILPISLTPWMSIATTESGDRLAVITRDAGLLRVHVLATATGRAVATPFEVGDKKRVTKMAFRRGGDALAIGTDDGVTRVWEWKTNTIRATHEGFSDPTQLVFSPDGTLVAEIDWSLAAALSVWSSSTGKEIYNLSLDEVPEGFVSIWATFTGDGRHLVASLGDSAVRVFALPAGDTVRQVLQFSPEHPILGIDVDPTGKFAAVASADGWVTVLRLEPEHAGRQFSGVIDVVPGPHGDVVAQLGKDSRIFEVGSGRTLLRLGEVKSSRAAVFSTDGRKFACTAAADRIVIADIPSGRTRTLHRRSEAIDLQFSSDGQRLLVAQDDRRLMSIDLARGVETELIETAGHVSGVFSSDGRFYAEKQVNRPIHLYDVAARKTLDEIASDAFDNDVVFSADGTLFAGRAELETVRIWSTATRAEVLRIPTGRSVGPTVFDRKGHHVAVAVGTEIRVADVRARKASRRLTQVGGEINTIAFSPDGSYLAAGCEDKNVRIWRVADGEPIMAIPQEESFRFGGGTVRFTADGKYLIVVQGRGSDGHFARFVLWRHNDVVREACRRSLRKELSRAEWQQFLSGQPYRSTCSEEELKGVYTTSKLNKH